jgi:Ca2+-binding RTX toxin-like protein
MWRAENGTISRTEDGDDDLNGGIGDHVLFGGADNDDIVKGSTGDAKADFEIGLVGVTSITATDFVL